MGTKLGFIVLSLSHFFGSDDDDKIHSIRQHKSTSFSLKTCKRCPAEVTTLSNVALDCRGPI